MNVNFNNLTSKINAESKENSQSSSITIIKNILNQVKAYTNGSVLVKINRYNRTIKQMSSIVNTPSVVFGDVQRKLGDVGDSGRITYELYITSTKLEKYKYRFAFVEIDLSSYPLEYVIDDDIAKELNIANHANIEDEKNLEQFIYNVINTDKITDVILKLYSFSD